MRGVTITLFNKEQIGVDDLNAPLYKETPVEVDNVLVAPVSSQEILEALQLHGKKVVLQLGIPKGDTNTWEDRRVLFNGNYYHTVGFTTEGLDHLVPTAWNKKIQLERYDEV